MGKLKEEKMCITVGMLIEHLKSYNDNDELIFGGGELTFYRTKRRGENLVQIEFNEVINNGKIVSFDED